MCEEERVVEVVCVLEEGGINRLYVLGMNWCDVNSCIRVT